jgi:hypothetical protein
MKSEPGTQKGGPSPEHFAVFLQPLLGNEKPQK